MTGAAFDLGKLKRVRVGWIADPGTDYVGGAELTERQFRAEAPDWADVVVCQPPGNVLVAAQLPALVDVWVVHNCTRWNHSIVGSLAGAPVVKYVHDMWPHGDPRLRRWLLDHAYLVFCSPLHLRDFTYPITSGPAAPTVLPPAMDLQRFVDAANAQAAAGTPRHDRALYLAHHLKGAHGAREWAQTAGLHLDLYGLGSLDLSGVDWDGCTGHGPIDHADVPALMASYQTFVHYPDLPEPFGRTAAEAWAAGCHVAINDNVGAGWWIANAPQMLAVGKQSEVFWNAIRDLVSLSKGAST